MTIKLSPAHAQQVQRVGQLVGRPDQSAGVGIEREHGRRIGRGDDHQSFVVQGTATDRDRSAADRRCRVARTFAAGARSGEATDAAIVGIERGDQAKIRVEINPVADERQQIVGDFVAAAGGRRVGGADRRSPQPAAGRGVEAGDVGVRRHVAVPHGDEQSAAVADRRAVERPALIIGPGPET